MDAATIIIGVLSAVGGGVVGTIIAGLFQRRKVKAEATVSEAEANDKIRATVMSLIDPLTSRVKTLEKEVSDLEAKNTALREWAEALTCQVKELGGVPVPFREPKTRPRTNE